MTVESGSLPQWGDSDTVVSVCPTLCDAVDTLRLMEERLKDPFVSLLPLLSMIMFSCPLTFLSYSFKLWFSPSPFFLPSCLFTCFLPILLPLLPSSTSPSSDLRAVLLLSSCLWCPVLSSSVCVIFCLWCPPCSQ